MTTLQTDQHGVFDWALGAKEACGECHGIGALNWENDAYPDWKIHSICVGTGKVPTALALKVLLAVSEECQGPLVPWVGYEECHIVWNRDCDGPTDRHYRDPLTCPCEGTGRTLLPISEEDTGAGRRSRDSMCGPLIRVAKTAYATSIPEDGDFELRRRFMEDVRNLDLPAAMHALRELVEAL